MDSTQSCTIDRRSTAPLPVCEGTLSRSARLLDLLQVLRRHRRPVTAASLAAETRVSLRTLYRDIATLQAQGVPIEGEAGLGYVLKPGFMLPPLMFDEDELDALILGLRFVVRRGDEDLGHAAENALAKIEAILPPAGRDRRGASPLLAGPGGSGETAHLATIRAAIRAERKLRVRYTDKKGASSERVIWPVAVGFFEAGEMLAAWCEARTDFRHFRLDRIIALAPVDARLPKRHRILLAEWRLTQDIDELP